MSFPPKGRCILCLALAALLATAGGLLAQPRASTGRQTRDISQFSRRHLDRRAKFVAALGELATDCEARGLSAAAEQIRELAEPVDTAELRFAPLPRHVQEPIVQDLPPDERHWRTQLRHERQEYAKDLYLLSRQTLSGGHVGLAYDLVREVAMNDPDHAVARRILGFVRNGDEWLSAFESQMLRERKVWHNEFGWILKEHVERYERGERFYDRRWMSAAKESELRQDFSRAWEIRTEHYLIRTNHSRERGVELARKLEDFHGLFFQVMAGFFNTPDQVQKLIQGASAIPQPGKPNVVHYYRSREEYLAALRLLTSQSIEITRGMYFPRNGISFFFFDPQAEEDDSTLYHEATHQLLSGGRPQTGEIGMGSNFWIIEGIACYMESFRRDGMRFSVGDPGHIRLQAARAHYLEEGYYVPLREFARMGMYAFQNVPPPKIGMNYSQGAGLTHFLMHYDDGRYREALIEHLSQVYSPNRAVRDLPESLEELTGVEAEVLDGQYREYLRKLLPSRRRETAAAPRQ